jgi:hypothetical protein
VSKTSPSLELGDQLFSYIHLLETRFKYPTHCAAVDLGMGKFRDKKASALSWNFQIKRANSNPKLPESLLKLLDGWSKSMTDLQAINNWGYRHPIRSTLTKRIVFGNKTSTLI